ncbi:serine/threonine-protein kinase [Streptomyces radicis]|uniref:serine/threonine-protein kinase n=1 Tax=Streptomyces radicis TaxID=1750517 RepID=UPI001E302DA3|nr:serine/threonine-protein kinase [Streptomyces radicis]
MDGTGAGKQAENGRRGERRDTSGWGTPPSAAPLQAWDPREISGYQLMGRLGAGGMGTVYLSTTRGGRPVALKVVHPDLAGEPRFRRRFQQEVNAARQVRGRYVAAVVDSNTEGPMPWLATEYVQGPSLSWVLNADGGPLDPPTVLRLVAGIASALGDIHAARVVHRDLKPGNVMLAAEGPVVIDFGIAQAADATSLTGTGIRVGTPGFMAPEQATGGGITAATDLFTLGLTAHVAATATHPFGEGPADVLLYRIAHAEPDLSMCPPELRPLIEPCLRREPDERPTAAEVLALCDELAGGLGLDDALPSTGWLPFEVPRPTPPSGPDASPTATATTPLPPSAPSMPVSGHPRYLSAPVPAPLTSAPAWSVPGPSTGEHRDRRPWLLVGLAGLLVAALGGGFVYASTTGDDGGNDGAQESLADDKGSSQEGASGDGASGEPEQSPAGDAEPDGSGPDGGDPDEPEWDDPEWDDTLDDGGDDAVDGGPIPDFFLGDWTATADWFGYAHTRTLEVRQASPGETAIWLTAVGTSEDGRPYHCEFEAELIGVVNGEVQLEATRLTMRDGACAPGDPTFLVRDGDRLVRENTTDEGPLTYTRAF